MNFELYYIPEHNIEPIINYIEHGIKPGSFLTSVICNDLARAVSAADYINSKFLKEIVSFFHMEVPMDAWGSEEVMEKWMARFK